MKKILLLLLLTTFSIQAQTLQNPTYGNVNLKNNVTDNSATKVNVQSTDGTINTISKSDLVNVVEVNDVPSLPLVGEVGKIYVVKNVNKIYRWNGTFYQELAGSDISGKEDIANKQNSLSVDGSNTKYPTVTAVNTGLALKSNDNAVVHLTGAETITGQKTFSPTISASGAIARGTYLTPSLTATANNDVLVGLDINTTFTNGAFTGTKSLPVRVTSNQYIGMNVSRNSTGGSAITISNNNGGYNFGVGSINEFFIQRAGGNIVNTIFSTGNSIIQNGGTFTDDLTNRLQVTGTVSSGTTALNNTPPIANNQLTRKDYVDTGLALKANLASPALTGTPTAPTATAGTNTTQVATTAFVANAYAGSVKLTGDDIISLGTKTFNISQPIIGAQFNISATSNGASAVAINNMSSGNAFYVDNKGGTAITVDLTNNSRGIFMSDYSGGGQVSGLFTAVKNSNVVYQLNSKGQVLATSYTATSLPVFENNVAASSLAVGQFYRTSTGVLMVKF